MYLCVHRHRHIYICVPIDIDQTQSDLHFPGFDLGKYQAINIPGTSEM